MLASTSLRSIEGAKSSKDTPYRSRRDSAFSRFHSVAMASLYHKGGGWSPVCQVKAHAPKGLYSRAAVYSDFRNLASLLRLFISGWDTPAVQQTAGYDLRLDIGRGRGATGPEGGGFGGKRYGVAF